jgi:glycine cleavage system H protein
MTTYDYLSIYDAKIAEYLTAVAYLLLFVPMWRYVQGERPAEVRAAAGARAVPRAVEAMRGWFHAPSDVELHPGHGWARIEPDGLVTVGLDEFAQRLIAPDRVRLPVTGDLVLQGVPAFAVGDQVATVPIAAPISGTVVAVNPAVRDASALSDPYGAGWLLKVKPDQLREERRSLFSGERARAWLEDAAAALAARMNPELGTVLQDGGTPVHGIAKALAGDGWPRLVAELLAATRRAP